MISTFKLCKNGQCGIKVEGLERDSDLYLDNPLVSIRNYTWEHSITLNAVYSIDSKENFTLESYSTVPHIDIDIDEITLEKDGLKLIDHFIIPTKEWLDFVKERDLLSLDNYSIVYYFNNDKFYKYHNGSEVEVSVNEILEVNANDTTLIKNSLNTFELCHLEECFFKLCLYLLNNMPCNDPCFVSKVSGFKQDILNRDIIWMAINAIKYCIDMQQFYRALSILELVETCWGICRDFSNIISSNYKGCGCSS